MIIHACVDSRNGMLFNGRRQSQDRALRQAILDGSARRPLWMNAYSARQFSGAPEGRLIVDPNFLAKAGPGEHCFVEDQPLLPWQDRIESLVLYRWGRTYPADAHLDLPLEGGVWRLRTAGTFPGFSHDLITKEVYTR